MNTQLFNTSALPFTENPPEVILTLTFTFSKETKTYLISAHSLTSGKVKRFLKILELLVLKILSLNIQTTNTY